ncbi:Histone deacetylase hda1 [Maublancomyces gigas]|uniref:histone deacetylase n=1 Tax=Discina gigas TaxID=1032678 RepID=A0ABR3GBJ6_9PEZI
MPFVPPFDDTAMSDAPNVLGAAALATGAFAIPLRVNGHADITFTNPYDPSTSRQVSPTGERRSAVTWMTEGFANNNGPVDDRRSDCKAKVKERHIALPVSSLKTGLCYDVRMMNHTQIFETEHPEQPKRIFLIYKALVDAMLLVDPEISGVSQEPGLMTRISAREVTYDEAMLAHSEEHWEYLASTAGNGTQAIFYDDPSILYMSIHRYDGGNFYPEGEAGDIDKCGEGKGVGMNVNIPWNNMVGGMGDGDYMYAFQRVVMPIALEFNPDIVIGEQFSAGFDAAAGDELGKCMVTPAGYAHMTHMLMSLANGKIVVCLEGGYNLDSISKSALAVTKVLMGEPPGMLHDGDKVRESAMKDVEACVIQQSRYWRCMRPYEAEYEEKRGEYRLHGENPDLQKSRPSAETMIGKDVIRSHQSKVLFESHKMTELNIFRDVISKSFENQVLATTDSYKAETIVLLVHDPGVCFVRIAPHNALLEDVGNMYIDWAVNKGFAVLDVNIPQALTMEDVRTPYLLGVGTGNLLKKGELAKKREYDMMKQTEEICVYLWDNYIEIADARNIILMGVGDAYVGILYLLANRECRERVKGVVGVVGEENSARAIMTGMHGDSLLDWYFQNSLVVCSKDHGIWEKTMKRGRKKFGGLHRATANTLQDVLRDTHDIVVDWIGGKVPPTS